MNGIRFSWDQAKILANVRNHGITFEEGTTVFGDENARLRYDPDHSQDEDRFILLGMSAKVRLLVVVHSHRESEEIVRIISTRKATKSEQKQYGSHL